MEQRQLPDVAIEIDLNTGGRNANECPQQHRIPGCDAQAAGYPQNMHAVRTLRVTRTDAKHPLEALGTATFPGGSVFITTEIVALWGESGFDADRMGISAEQNSSGVNVAALSFEM